MCSKRSPIPQPLIGGASVAGGYTERAEAAVEAGCDMILVCNNRAGAIEVLDNVKHSPSENSQQRLLNMLGKPFYNESAVLDREKWEQAVDEVTALA